MYAIVICGFESYPAHWYQYVLILQTEYGMSGANGPIAPWTSAGHARPLVNQKGIEPATARVTGGSPAHTPRTRKIGPAEPASATS